MLYYYQSREGDGLRRLRVELCHKYKKKYLEKLLFSLKTNKYEVTLSDDSSYKGSFLALVAGFPNFFEGV